MLRIHGTKLSQSKFSWMSWLGLAGTVSCCALVLVFGLMLFPALPQVTYAAIPEVTPSTGTSVGINLPASIDFDSVTPTPDGATTTATADLTVTTTNSASYSLYLYSSDGDNSLRPKISANTSSIIATAGGVGLTLSSLEPNTWGYNLGTSAPTDTTTYFAVPTDNSTPIQTKDTSDTNSANDTYTLSFGAKVDSTIASGAYSNSLTVAVVAEPKVISSLMELTYMQEMTPEICASSQENDTTRLIDSRDGKSYWVSKLKDGNCWMTQNLDLNLSSSKTLTSADSDLASDWTPNVSTEQEGTITDADASSFAYLYSWDPGMYVKNDPHNTQYCSGAKSLSDSECSSAGWVNVSNMTPMENAATNVAISNNTYNAHYLVGNYYQWNAATANTGNTIMGADAPGSICPKGWRLPQGGSGSENSFYELLQQYNLISSYDFEIITSDPLYFNPSGRIIAGALNFTGSHGNYWLSTADSTRQYYARFARFLSDEVQPNGSNDHYRGRRFGYSIRCLAR